jgi:hypothetical protein
MLNELIESVSARTGLSQDQAQAAVEAVIGLLKQRLPAPLAEMLGTMVNTGGASAAAAGASGDGGGLAGEAEALLGNLLGSKKEE